MSDLPPPDPEGGGAHAPPPAPATPPPPPPPPSQPPPEAPAPTSWPTPTGPNPGAGVGRGFPWKVVGILGALVLVGLTVAVFLVVRFVGDSGFTAHVDRANQYLDALRTDPPAAAAMRCQGAEDLFAERLSSSSGQYLSEFTVTNQRGEVTGAVDFPDGSTATVVVVTSGPALPSGDDPAAEVCILSTHLP